MHNERSTNFHEERLEETTVEQLQAAFEKDELTSRELVLLYFQRIAAFDKSEGGVNSILEINPDALQIAESLDYERKTEGTRGPLHGIPVLIKDNVATADKMHTSAGSLAMKDAYAKEDSFVVKKLCEAGALILGKTNMTEWANFIAEGMPSGYSSRGGQVLNPYGPNFDCGGSSSGTGAAIAANFATLGIGTETSGSILSPASQNSLVGVKPTVGLISRTGVIPISHTQDTAGPMSRTVKDAAILLNVLTGKDQHDPITKTNDRLHEFDFTSVLQKNGLNGARIGIPRDYAVDSFPAEKKMIIDNAIEELEKLGATIVPAVTIPSKDQPWNIDVMIHEFKPALHAYLQHFAVNTSIRTLSDLIQYNVNHSEKMLKYGQSIFEQCDRTSGSLTEAAYLNALAFDQFEAKENGIDAALSANQLDAMIYPNNLGAFIPAKAGYPSVTVPAGYTPEGEPVGITFTSTAYSEPLLLKYAYAYECATNHRKAPRL